MKQPLCLLLTFVLLTVACQQQNRDQDRTYANDTVAFFPVADFIRLQIRQVDSIPYFLYRLTLSGGRKDSLPISRADFLRETEIFTRYNILDTAVKKYYQESVFNDESTASYTLHYATQKADLPIRSIDVLLGQENQQVKRIFITLLQTSGDSTVLTRLGWKAHKSCSISRSIRYGHQETAQQTILVWNEKD